MPAISSVNACFKASFLVTISVGPSVFFSSAAGSVPSVDSPSAASCCSVCPELLTTPLKISLNTSA